MPNKRSWNCRAHYSIMSAHERRHKNVYFGLRNIVRVQGCVIYILNLQYNNNNLIIPFQSGLIKAVQESSVSVRKAEEMVLNFVKTYTERNKCLLAGNSVHVDKMFLNKYMPKFVDHLHYRIVDVSTVKELCK